MPTINKRVVSVDGNFAVLLNAYELSLFLNYLGDFTSYKVFDAHPGLDELFECLSDVEGLPQISNSFSDVDYLIRIDNCPGLKLGLDLGPLVKPVKGRSRVKIKIKPPAKKKKLRRA